MNNFLSIVWYRVLPAGYGGQKGIALFNEYLGKKVQLTCLCSRNNTAEGPISYKLVNELPSSRFQFWSLYVRKQILSYIKENTFTHIIIEHPYHAWLGKYKKERGFTFIVHAHNIEYLRMKARGKLWWRLVKRAERSAFESADHILFKTEADKKTAISVFGIAPGKCHIVPYGINETGQPAFDKKNKDLVRKRHDIADDEKIILFAGTLDYEPNAEAVGIIVKRIIPLLQKKQFRFRLVICGALPAQKMASLSNARNLTATGFVPLLQEYMQAADVFINPVITGSGIQTKNIEAIAESCTIVTTEFASAGLPPYLSGEKVFISPDNDWGHFTDNIIKACSVNNATPRRFYDEYNWQHIIERLLTRITPEDGAKS